MRTKPFTKSIYPNLVKELIERNETQKDLGDAIGLSKTSVNYKFTGKVEWSISEIEKVCEYFGKDYYELFKRD